MNKLMKAFYFLSFKSNYFLQLNYIVPIIPIIPRWSVILSVKVLIISDLALMF